MNIAVTPNQIFERVNREANARLRETIDLLFSILQAEESERRECHCVTWYDAVTFLPRTKVCQSCLENERKERENIRKSIPHNFGTVQDFPHHMEYVAPKPYYLRSEEVT